jgi:hypothetical protein
MVPLLLPLPPANDPHDAVVLGRLLLLLLLLLLLRLPGLFTLCEGSCCDFLQA